VLVAVEVLLADSFRAEQDTIAKRLMSNKAAFKMSEMNDVIFRKAANQSAGVRFMSLFPGEQQASKRRTTSTSSSRDHLALSTH
jgi:hypothetical protein